VDYSWTPLKDGKIYTGRQYFSSTDVVDEFIKCRDNDEYIVQYIVFPHQQIDDNTGKRVLHNRVRILVFPDADTVVRAMQQSSPGCDPYSINRETGQNKNVPDGNGGSTLSNDAGADWFAFQEALGQMGYMGIVDLEGSAMGAEEYSSGSISPRFVSALGLATVAAVIAGVVRYHSQIKTALSSENVETVDGHPETPEGFHFWRKD